MSTKINAEYVSLEELTRTILPGLLSPLPHRVTLQNWFEAAGVRTIKANPNAPHGGGRIYYKVADVKAFFFRKAEQPVAA